MSRCRNCDPIEVAGCQCNFEDSDDINFSGLGSANNPVSSSVILDPDSDNITTSSVSGLLTLVPDEIANPPRCHIRKTTTQIIPTNTTQVILGFDDPPEYDTAGMFDGTGNPSRMTITSDGLYVVYVAVGFAEPAVDAYAVFGVWRQPSNASVISAEAVITNGPGAPHWRIYASVERELTAGEYLEVRVFQNTGGDLNTEGAVLATRRVAPLS